MVYTAVSLADVETIAGEWPEADFVVWPGVEDENAILAPPSEGFLVRHEDDRRSLGFRQSRKLVTCSPEGAGVEATLVSNPPFITRESARVVRIRIPSKLVGNATRGDYLEAGRKHFGLLAGSELPGGAWFRFRLNAIEAELGSPQGREDRRRGGLFVRPDRRGDIEETYDFFSAGRAVSENLRLDRSLAPIEGGAPDIPIETLPGIETKAFDWTKAIEKLSPRKDPLAVLVPEDQHGAFFKNLILFEATIDGLESQVTPLAAMATGRSEHLGIRPLYEGQLGFRLSDAVRDPVLGAIVKSVAVTGSDPYFATGTDLAVLLEVVEPKAAYAVLELRHRAIAATRPDAALTRGELLGTPYAWLRTPDRAVSSVIAAVGPALVVTNSLAQLNRIVETFRGTTPALASSPEYVFFRDRYPLRYDFETAFVLLTDATIRRWCGPKWRIGAARRTRAAAQLSQLTAENADAIVRGLVKPGPHAKPDAPPGLDPLTWTADAIHSGPWGSLRFLTPILELDVSKVTKAESDAYDRFRQAYQREWMQFFDPIAVQFSLTPSSAAFDVTVMPLVESSEYRELMEIARSVRFGPTACDPHETSLVHLAIAVDAAAAAMEDWDRAARRLSPDPEKLGLAWLRGGVSVCLDRDPIFRELDPERPERKLLESLGRIPLILTVEVRDPVALALFLTGVRARVEDTALGSVQWTKGSHHGVETMTLSGIPAFVSDETLQIRYAIVDGLLIVTFREDLLHQAIDRALDRRAGKPAESRPWLGESAAIRVDKGFVDLVAAASHRLWSESQRELAWRALPILTEWHRIWPDQDPVLVHEKLFKVRLVDPAGGAYVVERDGLISSETYGNATETRPGPARPKFAEGVKEARGGLTFENDGVRARFVIERER